MKAPYMRGISLTTGLSHSVMWNRTLVLTILVGDFVVSGDVEDAENLRASTNADEVLQMARRVEAHEPVPCRGGLDVLAFSHRASVVHDDHVGLQSHDSSSVIGGTMPTSSRRSLATMEDR